MHVRTGDDYYVRRNGEELSTDKRIPVTDALGVYGEVGAEDEFLDDLGGDTGASYYVQGGGFFMVKNGLTC